MFWGFFKGATTKEKEKLKLDLEDQKKWNKLDI